MPNPDKQEFYIRGKDEIKNPDAPVISDEFIDTTREEGLYQGQTIEVRSDTKLEEDKGTGDVAILRTFRFTPNPEIFNVRMPSIDEIFASHQNGIMGLLWQDGMTPDKTLEPKFILSPDRSFYLIQVWARPSVGQTVIDETRTLSEIIKNDTRTNTNNLHGGVQLSPAEKKASKRTAKTAK